MPAESLARRGFSDGDALARLLPVLFGAVQGQAIKAAAELRLADLLGTGTGTVDSLAQATETDPAALRRLLRLLVRLDILADAGNGEFRATETGALLRQDHPSTVRHYALMNNTDWMMRVESRLVESLKSGQSAFQAVHGADCYEYIQARPAEAAVFNAALTELSKQDYLALREVFDFSSYQLPVDVGGGEGFLLSALLGDFNKMSGTLLDLPGMTSAAAEVLSEPIRSGRCRIVTGDFRESVPEGGDLYILKRVLSTCAVEDGPVLLRNIRASIRADGCLLVADPDPDTLYGALFDVLMLNVVGGALHTESELRPLLAEAGFRVARAVSTPATLRLVEAVPD